MDEAAARRVVLAQAIEAADKDGRLLPPVERDRIEVQAREAVGAAADPDSPAAISRFLQARSQRVLQAVAVRDRAIASLQERSATERWLMGGLPPAALLLGIFTDQVANPHQVNLLSKPLLLLLLWNLVVYATLAASVLLPHRRSTRGPRLAGLRRSIEGWREWRRRPGHLRSEVTASFLLRWHQLTAALYGQRLARVLHLAAAAWAFGVALSLFFGGVWASYGVQWESTFLSAEAVHGFLSVLFKPVTALFPWASFSLEEVRSLRASGPMPGVPGGSDNFTGRRWVFLYAALLAMVVVLPRLVLAAVAGWNERRLARAVELDLRDGYFQRLLSSLSPAQVQLGLYAHRGEDRAALLRVLLHRADPSLRGVTLGQGEAHELLRGPGGEVMRIVDIPDVADPRTLAARAAARPGGWAGRLRDTLFGSGPHADAVAAPAGPDPLRTLQADTDVVLHVVGEDDERSTPLLQWLDKPVLLLVTARRDSSDGSEARSDAAPALPFERFAQCWIQEPVLLEAIAALLPAYKAAGFERLRAAWEQRNLEWLRESMAVLAQHLLGAAHQAQDVGKPPNALLGLVRRGEREQYEGRSREAMGEIVERLERSDTDASLRLLALHGIAPSALPALNHRLEEKFVVQGTGAATSAGAAGMAGAASGAALGVSIDLVTAGLTLGMAAAAGALVGGGAAWVAAVWKNKATPAGTSVVQLSDEMLQAMVEAGLLRYLAIVHLGRPGADPGEGALRPGWRSEVVAAVERRSADLKEQWAIARQPRPALEPAAALVGMLESMALDVLRRLYPSAATGR